MTKREIVSRLRQDLNEHFSDSVLFNRHLWNAFWTASRVLVQREADNNKLKDQSRNFKTYNLDTEDVNLYEGTCVPLECIACRAKVPKLMVSKNGPIYGFIGSPDMHTSYTVVSPLEYAIKTKITGTKAKFAFIEGDYLYFSKCLSCVKLVGIPDGDDDADGASCSVMDDSVAISDYLIEGSLAMAKQSLTVVLQKPYDHVANKNTQS